MGVDKVLGRAPTSSSRAAATPAAGARAGDPEALREGQKLGIPALRDRIVQMATKLVLEPIFEADFCPTSYGFRPGRRAQDAIEEVRFFINAPRVVRVGDRRRRQGLLRADPSRLLMEQVRRRVTDKRVLALIRLFLGAGVMREHGTVTATPSGTPQGSILSPLLSNIALSVLDRHFETAWASRTHNQRGVTGPTASPAIE